MTKRNEFLVQLEDKSADTLYQINTKMIYNIQILSHEGIIRTFRKNPGTVFPSGLMGRGLMKRCDSMLQNRLVRTHMILNMHAN